VPSHISEVVTSKNKDLFWRYDMDSYAANRHNEDRSHCVHDSFTDVATGATTPLFFCACYDGHGGEQAVEFVQRKLFPNIKARLEAGGESTKLSIINGFRDTDEEFHRQSRRKFQKGEWSACSVGACAVIALLVGKKLFVASCGDCRAIMAFRDASGELSVEQITADHSANEVGEQRRLRVLHPDDYDIVREIGARNFYVKGRLQPTRSLGDTYMKVKDVNKAPMPRGLRIHGSFKRPYITAVPDVFEVDVAHRHPEFLVLGSDGLYGEMSNVDIAQHVAKFRDAGEPNVSARCVKPCSSACRSTTALAPPTWRTLCRASAATTTTTLRSTCCTLRRLRRHRTRRLREHAGRGRVWLLCSECDLRVSCCSLDVPASSQM
jgi:pyruvate dehydrogenase phosphatase